MPKIPLHLSLEAEAVGFSKVITGMEGSSGWLPTLTLAGSTSRHLHYVVTTVHGYSTIIAVRRATNFGVFAAQVAFTYLAL